MIRLYNTQTRTKEDFNAINRGEVHMYVCGPTVYNYIHIGNARTFISFDVIRRYFMWRGFKVTFVQNVTDVDDKIIKKANEEGATAAEIAERYTKAFIDDMHAVGVLDPDVRPKATEEIPEMIELVQRLIDTGHAYEAAGDVYFSVRSFPEYGELSHRDIDELESGHRDLRASDVDGIEDRKRDPLDFAVWKAAKPGEPSWKSPWGMGRPGWHIECSAMSQINAEKMSKSLGNFLLLRDVLKTTKPSVLRMLMMQTHYRSPLDFSQDRLEEAAAALERIQSLVARIDWAIENAQDIPSPLDTRTIVNRTRETRNEFIFAMDDDFNTAGGLGVIFTFVGELNTALGDKTVSISDVPVLRGARDVICELMNVFGTDLSQEATADGDYPVEVVDLAAKVAGYAGADAHEAVDALLEARTKARAEKNFAVADAVRDGLTGLGFTVEDTPQGPRVTFGD